jgi:hypothetical protein
VLRQVLLPFPWVSFVIDRSAGSDPLLTARVIEYGVVVPSCQRASIAFQRGLLHRAHQFPRRTLMPVEVGSQLRNGEGNALRDGPCNTDATFSTETHR